MGGQQAALSHQPHTHLETLQPQPQAEIKVTGVSLVGLPRARTPQDPAAPTPLDVQHLPGPSVSEVKWGPGALDSSSMAALTPHLGHGVSLPFPPSGAEAQGRRCQACSGGRDA